ncbi:hypothetical protein ACEVJL_04555 [Pseudoflavonifractor sp. P01025]|uniref:vWA domain-containing protein n=1 Tax=Flintibacter porci TaxID=3342383 RepID=UPI0035B68749
MNEPNICICDNGHGVDRDMRTEHYQNNFIPTGWELVYTALDHREVDRTLYLNGMCLRCGGKNLRIGKCIPNNSREEFLECLYQQVRQYRPYDQRFEDGTYRTKLSMRAQWYMEQDDLTLGARNAQFLKLFHPEDQAIVEEWLNRCHAEEPYTAPRRDRKSTLLYAVLDRAWANGDLKEIEPIICMLDESSSTEDQAAWCKAVALALLDIAMRDQRRFAVVHFAGVGHFQTDLFLPGQYTREDVLRCAETFLNGNTDYETPLREALRLMEQEGFENADMVFVTDGECALPDSFLENLKEEQTAKGFQITGILLDQGNTVFEFSLREFCTNVYRTSQLSHDQIAEQLVVSRIA